MTDTSQSWAAQQSGLDPTALSARRAHISRQLDLMLETRGPVAVVRRLVADLDSISEDLARALRTASHESSRDAA